MRGPSSSADAAIAGAAAVPRRGAQVAVLGGGPAGAVAALCLARRGHAVTLVERGRLHPGSERSHPCETLAAGALPLLAELGLADLPARCGARADASSERHWPPAAANRADGAMAAAAMAAGGSARDALALPRDRFDALLRQAACAAGARLLGAHAGAPQPLDGGWATPLRHDGRHTLLRADLVIDARGRRGAPAAADGPRSVALCGHWRPRHAAGEATGDAAGGASPFGGSVVAAHADGWVWLLPSVGVSAGTSEGEGAGDGAGEAAAARCVAAFVDAAALHGLDGGGRERLYRRHLAAAAPLSSRLAGCVLVALRVCDATPRAAADAAPAPGLLLAGDAAACIDPLSSQGLAAALRSGVQAAACVHTAWHRPADAALAWELHRARSRAHAQRHARLAGSHHAAPAAQWPGPFWTPRARAAPPVPAWPDLQARLALAANVRIEPHTVLDDGWVRQRPALAAPGFDEPVTHLAGVPIERWLAALGAADEAPTLAVLLDRWHAAFGPARTAAAFGRLWQAGALSERGAAAARAPSPSRSLSPLQSAS
ncbi:MAG: FAD-dependent monooxygenase [Proteobacteria bacterium]|nr:FAD-dependent monooxygenase [Pseudomonadota bacterium]